MDKPAAQAAEPKPQPRNASPLSCLPLLAGVALFTMLMAWIIGWWKVPASEHSLQKNMLEVARAAVEYREQFGEYPQSFEQLSEYSLMINPPLNPYSGEPTRFIDNAVNPQPGDISLHRVAMNGAAPDLLIIGYGLRPVPEERRSDWAVLPGGVDPERVLSAISVNALPEELLVREVEETTDARQAAERWKLPETE